MDDRTGLLSPRSVYAKMSLKACQVSVWVRHGKIDNTIMLPELLYKHPLCSSVSDRSATHNNPV